MAKEVKIISFRTTDTISVGLKTPQGKEVERTFYMVEDAEAVITDLVNKGWQIVAGGAYSESLGFVVVQHDGK